MRHIFSGEVGFRPAPRLGIRPRLGQQGILKCNLPTNQAIGFSPVDCSQIWTSPGGAVAGFPNCVQAAGKWTHPDCVTGAPPGAPAPAPMTGPEILVCPQPDGKWTVLDYMTHEIIKRDVQESEFRTITDNHITYLPEEWVCKDPNSPCAPYCGEAAAPEPTPEPTPTSAPEPEPAPAPTPTPSPRPIPTLPGGGPLPGLPIGPIPTTPMPRLPASAPAPRTTAQKAPIPVPCGAKLPTYIRSLRTVTAPTSMSDWSESWIPWS